MYAREYPNTNQNNRTANIPVENFDPGPSLSEFARRTDIERLTQTNQLQNTCETCEKCETNTQTKQVLPASSTQTPCTCQNSCEKSSNKGFLGLKTDDLLLIFIIILLISDNDESNDIMIPILLGLLLIF